MASSRVADFYASIGQALADDTLLPRVVQRHLTSERTELNKVLVGAAYSAVVEAGCMDGRLLASTVLHHSVAYLGIDLIPSQIEKLNARLQSLNRRKQPACALAMDIVDIQNAQSSLANRNVLVVFPFNSFGNLAEPIAAARSIACCGYDLLVFTYRNDDATCDMRHHYYRSCGFNDLKMTNSSDGVLFSSGNGLHSLSYSIDWFQRVLGRCGFRISIEQFGDFGLMVRGFATMEHNGAC